MPSEWAIADLVSPSDVEKILAAQDGWTLGQALLAKVEQCKNQGARVQMMNALGQLFRAGNQYFYSEHLRNLESNGESDATGEY